MYIIKETTDMELINKTFHSPNNIGWAYDDTVREQEQFNIGFFPEKLLYFAAYSEEGTFLGCILGIKTRKKELELHVAFLPRAYGKTVEISKELIEYIKKTYPEIRLLLATVAANNKMAERYVKRVGFIYNSHKTAGWLKDKINHGLNVYCYNI